MNKALASLLAFWLIVCATLGLLLGRVVTDAFLRIGELS